MMFYSLEDVRDWLREISLRPGDFSREEDYDITQTESLAMSALDYLEELRDE